MKKTIIDEKYGLIVYDESFWTGKKKLSVGGEIAKKVSKKAFDVGGKIAVIKGSYLFGLTITIDGDVITVTPKPTWYETALMLLPIIFMLFWGNVEDLVLIFPVVGGAIGGVIGALGMCFSILLMGKVKKPIFKVLIGLGMFAATVLTGWYIALVIILGIL